MSTNEQPIDAEVMPQGQSTAVARRQSMEVGQAMNVKDILAQVRLIQEVMREVMVDKEHYGTIPGCGDKKTLLQPGAQKLCMTFRLAPEYQIQEVNLDRGHKEYRVTCTLKTIQTGNFVGQGVGCCSSMESKYRFRGGARKCPKCGKEAIIMGKRFKPTDPEPGWLCWTKKEGCGTTWPKGAQEIEAQSIEKQENDNPADTFNTVLKMAKKRAFVDATITATAASDIFTQDIGDEDGGETHENAPGKPANTPAHAQGSAQPRNTAPAPTQAAKPPVVVPFPTAESRAKMIKALLAGPGEGSRDIVTEFFRKTSCILPEAEEIEDIPLRFVPATAKQMQALAGAVAAFGSGDRAQLPYPQHDEPVTPKEKAAAKPAPAAATPATYSTSDDPNSPTALWRSFPVPFGSDAGTPLAKLSKGKLFGWWANFKVETEYNGKPKKPETIAKDTKFREMLTEAGRHYLFSKDPEHPEGGSKSDNDETEDVPF